MERCWLRAGAVGSYEWQRKPLFSIHGVTLHLRRNLSQDKHPHTFTYPLPLFGPLPECGPGCGTHLWLCVSCRAASRAMAWDCGWGGCAVGTPPHFCRDPVVRAFQVSSKGTGAAWPWATPVSCSGLPFHCDSVTFQEKEVFAQKS